MTVLALTVALGGCYLVQSAAGQFALMRKRQPIEANTTFFVSSLIAMVTCAHASSLLAFAQSPWAILLRVLKSAA